MAEWLQPVPASIVFELLQYKIAEVKRGDVEHLEYRYCVTSYLHDLQSEEGPKRNVDYARMWGYSESWVSRNISAIRKEAMGQASFYGSARVKQDAGKTEARPAQEETSIPGDLAGSAQDSGKSEARPKQEPSKTYISESLDLQTTEEKNRSANALSAVGPPPVPYDEVMESWNAFATDVGLSKIVAMSPKRKTAVKARYRKVWPDIEAVYAEIRSSDFLLGLTGSWGGATFDFVWCKTEGAVKILEGQYRNKGAGNGKRQNISRAPDKFATYLGYGNPRAA